jgi:hypothetical protein
LKNGADVVLTLRISMKDFGQTQSCIARRSTGLSNGGAVVMRRRALPFIGLTSQIACGAWLRTSPVGLMLRMEGHVDLPATRARIAISDWR